MKYFLRIKIVEYSLAAMIIVSSLLCVFTPELAFFQRAAELTVHIMLTILLLGLFFLVFSQERLLMISLAAVIFLAIFLKQASNSALKFPEINSLTSILVAHVNVSNIDNHFSALKQKLIQDEIDIISFQEVTPDWHYLLSAELSEYFPNSHSMVRIDYYGMAVYSKKEILNVDTLIYGDIPNLEVEIRADDKMNISILSSYMLPPLYDNIDLERKGHFDFIRDHINAKNQAYIALGDFNLTYWSSDIRNFKRDSKLENSRHDISQSGFRIPHDHIFFNNRLECTNFEEITDPNNLKLGIKGFYQFKNTESNIGKSEYSSKVELF